MTSASTDGSCKSFTELAQVQLQVNSGMLQAGGFFITNEATSVLSAGISDTASSRIAPKLSEDPHMASRLHTGSPFAN